MKTNAIDFLLEKLSREYQCRVSLTREFLSDWSERCSLVTGEKQKINIKVKNGFAIQVVDNSDKWRAKK